MNLIFNGDTSKAILLFMADSTTPTTGATGKTLTVRLSKNGAAFAAGAGTVAELEGGFYAYTPAAADVGTNGPLGIRATATGAVDFVAVRQVVPWNPYDAVRLGLSALPNLAAGANGGLPTGDASGRVLLQPTQTGVTIPTVTTTTNLTNLPTMPTDWLTAAGLSAGAVTEIQSGLSTYAGGDTTGITTLLGRLTAGRGTNLDFLDVSVNSRLAAASYAAPPGSGVVAAAVWDLVTTGHTGAGSFGAAMNAAGSAGDPLSTLVPGAYGIGTAGYRLGTYLDSRVGACSTHTAPDVWAVAGRTLTAFSFAVVLDPVYNAAKTAAQAGDAMALTTATGNALVAATAAAVSTDHGSGSYLRNTEPDNTSAAAVLTRVNLLSLDGSGRVTLAPAGLDAVGVEGSINARQALAGCLSYAAGAWNGSFPGVVTFAAAGSPGTVRMTATVTATSRTGLTLSLPA